MALAAAQAAVPGAEGIRLGSGRRVDKGNRRNTEPPAMLKPTAQSDARLMRRIGEGDQDAYRHLVALRRFPRRGRPWR